VRKKAADKKSIFGADLIEGMKLVAAHQRGEIELEQVLPKPIDVKAIRKRVKKRLRPGRSRPRTPHHACTPLIHCAPVRKNSIR
jgi:hypothetical protein